MKLRRMFVLGAATLLFAVGVVAVGSAENSASVSSPATAAQSIELASGSAHGCPGAGKANCAEHCKSCPSFKDANNDGVCDQAGNCANQGKCGGDCRKGGCQGKCGEHGKACPSYQDANRDGKCDQTGNCPGHGKARDGWGRCRQGKCAPPAGGCGHGGRPS